MFITGKTIFKLVYILTIITTIVYVIFNALQHNPLDQTFLFVAVASILLMSLLFIKISKKR